MNGQNLGAIFEFLILSSAKLHIFYHCNITVYVLPPISIILLWAPITYILDYYNTFLRF